MTLTTRRLLVAILFLALFVMATREISDPDFWWHLRTGQFILETNSIPHADIFSHTNAGRTWVTHEWLSEVIMYSIYRVGSFPALILAFAAIITLTFLFVYVRSEGTPFVAALTVLLAAMATAPTWGVRPQMLSMLLTSIFIFILERKGRGVWLLIPLMLLWVNLHSGFALGIAIIGVYLAGDFAQPVLTHYALRTTHQPQRFTFHVSRLTVVLLACLLVVPLNPNGATMFVYPFETLTSRAMQTYIQEWFSPDFHLLEFQPFAILLIATFASFAFSRKEASVAQILLLTLFGYAALRSARMIPIFALVAAPILAANVWTFLETRGWKHFFEFKTPNLPTISALLNWCLLIVIAAAGILRIGMVISNQSTVERTKFPAAAVDFLHAQPKAGELFNSYGWGGYLIWRLYPQTKVFIDGRADVYGDAFIEDFLRVYRANSDWGAALERYRVNTVLVEPDAPLSMRLAEDGAWKKIFEDRQAVIYRK